MGLTPKNLLMAFLVALLLLVALFVFIFIGIAGLTTGSEFGAVINALLPVVAGLAASGVGQKDNVQRKYDLKQIVKDAFRAMRESSAEAANGRAEK